MEDNMIAQTQSQTTVSSWLRQHRVLAYFILTLAISWSIELPLVASAQGWITAPIPFALHYLASFGPLLAALIMTWVTGGTDGLKELWGRITKWRVGSTGVTFAFLSPVVLFALAAVVVWVLSGGEWPDLRRLTEINYLPNLGIGALVLWLVTFGFGEEIGWRGYALPRLQRDHSALSATLILGVMWVAWHVPAFFYLDTYVNLGLAVFPMFALGVLTGGIVLTWLYNTTGGSVLMVAIWHGVFDFLSASKASDGYIAALMSAVIMIWAVVIVIVYKPANLSRQQKHIL
jgi:membrane protease YdiL (CAAX protease family)